MNDRSANCFTSTAPLPSWRMCIDLRDRGIHIYVSTTISMALT